LGAVSWLGIKLKEEYFAEKSERKRK